VYWAGFYLLITGFRKKVEGSMKAVIGERSFWRFSLVCVLICTLFLTGTVYGKDSGEDVPPDPGSGSGQDNTKGQSTKWVLIHGQNIKTLDDTPEIIANWDLMELVSSPFSPGQGDVVFIGVEGLDYNGDGAYFDATICGNGNGIRMCDSNNNVNGNGGGVIKASDTCGGAWITPGKITANAQQIAPNSVLVIGQNPAENGVTVDWHVTIQPTSVTYYKWELIGHRFVACGEDTAGEPYELPEGMDEACPHGWHSIIEHIWTCNPKTLYVKEGIGDLSADATLQLESRAWILGELARAYPGAHLKNPDWGFSTTPSCVWVGDVCHWDFTLKIPVADPGWYDLKVSGLTTGTKATPPRSFEILAGEFGAYLIDSTEMIN
jgi:hypothetical protein